MRATMVSICNRPFAVLSLMKLSYHIFNEKATSFEKISVKFFLRLAFALVRLQFAAAVRLLVF